MTKFKQRHLLSAILVLGFSLVVNGAGIKIGDLHYILNDNEGTATVTYSTDEQPNRTGITGTNYSELTSLSIPTTVNYEGREYTVIEIGQYAFFGNKTLQGDLDIPETITTISDYAFCVCSINGGLHLPETLKTLERYCFYSCHIQGNIVIPENLTSISTGAFSSCSGLTGNLILPAALQRIESEAFNNCSGLIGDLIIPETVTEIGDYAFNNCSGLTGNLIIPEGVKEIGYNTFWACGFDGELTLPQSLRIIGGGAFGACHFRGELILPDELQVIGENSFCGNSFTGSLNIPNGIIEIPNSAFDGCEYFSGDLIIPENVKVIGSNAFWGCKGFNKLFLPNNMDSIGNGAFYNCGFYGTLFIPDGVEKIEDFTFYNNDFVTFDTIVFPSTIKSIGEFSFVGADTIVCHAENPPIGLELIGRKNYTSPLYVPWESIDLYEGIEGLGWPVYDCPYEYYSIGDLNDTHIHLNVGESVYASLVYGTEVEIETPDAKVVSVRANKVITGIAPGTQAMSAIDGNGTYIDFYVHVYSVEAESIDINISEAQLKASETLQLSATVYPDNTTDKTIEWVSSNESVATVTESGLVTAVSVGQTVITAICGSVQTTCTISVVPTLATAILLDRDAVSATLGEEFQLIATVLPVETTDKRVAWSSSNESVATVDTEGLVKIINTGLCVITAATTDGSDLKAECVISPTTGINTMPQDCVGTDIYSPTGLLLHKGATDYELRNLASGIYIVKTGNDIRKIVVK